MSNDKKNRLVLYKVYFSTLLNNINNKGIVWLIKRLLLRGLKELGWMLLLPISIALHLLGFRRLPIRVEHIGHLATEFDTFVKAKRLGLISKKYYFVLASYHKTANAHLLDYWHSHVAIVTNSLFCVFLEVLTRRYFMCDPASSYTVKFFGTQPIYEINKLWGERSPILTLSNEDEVWGELELDKLGLAKNKWFVCLHVREGGFLPHNEHIQAHRNASIENTTLAMQEIIKRGGLVVRMGDASMAKLPEMAGVIDYAHHPLKSERMDVVLCAKAKFFLGCTSGLAFLSMIFGVPVAHANMIPIETLGIRLCDLSIPKLLKKQSNGNYLHFNEIMTTDIGGYFFSHQYKESGIIDEENTSEDILMLVSEMLDRLDGHFMENEKDKELHAHYMSLFRPGHYSFGAASQVGHAFISKYQHLLT